MGAIDLDTVTIQPEAKALVSETVANIYRILPLRLENDGRDLVVAAANPSLNALDDLRFMLSHHIITVEAEPEKLKAAIERCYVDSWREYLQEMIDELNARGITGVVGEWLLRVRRFLRPNSPRLCAAPHVKMGYQILVAVIVTAARESFVEHSRRAGLFRMTKPDGEAEEFPLPPKIARRIVRRIMHMAKIKRGGAEGSFRMSIRGAEVNCDVTSERTADGERVAFRFRKAAQTGAA